ncbi:MAG TPA: hypothetical protein VMM93_07790 [Vicinamibacterales bacterium]|nr:hypothetical protein [Vicinamibacterales bacterium]
MRRYSRSSPGLLRLLGLLGPLALLAAACSGAAGAPEGTAADVRALTGAHTRIVWVQSNDNDPRAEGEGLVLMGLDTDDGRGERVIGAERRSRVKPMLTADGARIVFSTRIVPGPAEVFVVNWDGTGQRKVADGFALDVWKDPADGREWVYLGTKNVDYDFSTVARVPLDGPGPPELVWDKTLVGMDTFQVSADGRLAGGLWPWPEAGVARLPNGPLEILGQGCWTGLAHVRGPLFWYFDGAHRNLTLVDAETKGRWVVNINNPPGFDGAEVYHPRWSPHPRFLTMTGPYNQGGDNQARTGGPQTEVYVGRFSPDFSRVEAWARATTNARGDSSPDVWIDIAGSPHATTPAGPVGPPGVHAGRGAATPADTGRLVVNVRLTRPGPVPTPESILPYRNALVVNEYEVMDVVSGSHAGTTIHIAQWIIRDGRMLPGARKLAGAAFTLTIDRYDAHPELEGERLISDRETSDLTLYYDPRVD